MTLTARTLRHTLRAVLVLALAGAWPRDASAAGRRQDLVAHGSEDRFWIGNVSVGTGADNAQVRTDLFVRSVGESRWQPVTRDPIESRVVAMAHRGPQLALLLDDGSWLLVSEQALVTGRPPPGNGQVVDLASDRDTLLALVRLRNPASPAGSPGSPAVAPPAASHRLALFALGQAGWAQQGELGPAAPDPWADVSLAVVESTVFLAAREGAGPASRVRLLRQAPGGAWGEAGSVALRPDAASFKLIGGGPVPVLWVLGRDGAFSLHWFGPEGVETRDVPAPRDVDPQEMAAAFAFDRVRVLYTAGGLRYERQYDAMPVAAAESATTRGAATAPGASTAPAPVPAARPANQDTRILLPARPLDLWVMKWVQPLLSVALLFTIVASLRRRTAMQEAMLRANRFALAPWGRRFAAGMIDAIPLLAAFGLLWARDRRMADGSELWDDSLVQAAALAGPVLYILHTTVSEVLFGRTIGKVLCGLRVVGLDGKRPTPGALLTRNLLRVIDILMGFLPLVLILYSPLRQRAGDVAAGTMVVRDRPATPKDEGEGRESEAETVGAAERD
jgi:uncharacterized RDD family membrane protein YckC